MKKPVSDLVILARFRPLFDEHANARFRTRFSVQTISPYIQGTRKVENTVANLARPIQKHGKTRPNRPKLSKSGPKNDTFLGVKTTNFWQFLTFSANLLNLEFSRVTALARGKPLFRSEMCRKSPFSAHFYYLLWSGTRLWPGAGCHFCHF